MADEVAQSAPLKLPALPGLHRAPSVRFQVDKTWPGDVSSPLAACKASYNKDQAEEEWDYDQLDWDNGLVEISGLEDETAKAELARQQLFKDVYMYELVNSNVAYQRHMRMQQDRQQEDAHVLAQYDVRPKAHTALARCWGSWRSSYVCKEAYMSLAYPEHSRPAWHINNVIILAILWSTAMFCAETVPRIAAQQLSWIRVTDCVCLGLFTVEFLGRLVTCPSVRDFAMSPANIIDFLAIFPAYIEIILVAASVGGEGASQTKVLRIVRLLRILRLLRIMSRFQNVQVILDAVAASADVLALMFFLLMIILLCFSAVIYYIEGDVNPNIDSIPQAMWFIQTTLTTTGYGDVTPLTWAGKAVTGVMMLCAIVTLALPISVIGANFTNMWMEYKSMRSAAARSDQVWTNFRTLNTQVAQHRAVLEDVSQNFHRVRSSLKCSIDALLDTSRQARLLYLMRSTQGKSPGWERDTEQLRRWVEDMRHSLTEARQWSEHLQVATELSHMTHADEFVSRLDRMHMAYKNLRKWFEEGVYMAQEVKLLTGDIRALKDTLQRPPTDKHSLSEG